MIDEGDRRIRTPMVLRLIALICLVCCPVVGLVGLPSAIVPLVVSWALACSFFGVNTSVLCIGRAKVRLIAAALTLNVLPPFALAGSIMWLVCRLDS